MPRFFLASVAAVAMIAGSAHAAGFGSASLTASSSSSAGQASGDTVPLLAALLGFFSIEFSATAGVSTTGTDKPRDQHSPVSKECEQAKEEEREQLAETKRLQNTSPEPLYLAF